MSYNDIFTGMLVVFVIYQHLMLNHKIVQIIEISVTQSKEICGITAVELSRELTKKLRIIETDIQDALDKHFKDIS